jgi:SnoaL-like domain
MLESAPPPVAKLLDAANANDTEAFLALFVEGGVVDDWGMEFVGADAIRGWSDREFIGKHVSLAIRGIGEDGQAIVVTAEVGGKGFNGRSCPSPPRHPNGDQVVLTVVRESSGSSHLARKRLRDRILRFPRSSSLSRGSGGDLLLGFAGLRGRVGNGRHRAPRAFMTRGTGGDRRRRPGRGRRARTGWWRDAGPVDPRRETSRPAKGRADRSPARRCSYTSPINSGSFRLPARSNHQSTAAAMREIAE